jgi:hypothetical protein
LSAIFASTPTQRAIIANFPNWRRDGWLGVPGRTDFRSSFT